MGWTGEARGYKILVRHSVGHTLILDILLHKVADGAVPLCDAGEWGLSF